MNDTNTSSQTGATPDQAASELPGYNQANLSEGPVVILSMECIQPNPYQSRLSFPEQELQDLAASIAEIGLIVPIAVRKLSDFSYQIIAGERRFRAFQVLNKTEISCHVFLCSDADMAIMALAENIRRQDLCDYEIAKGIHAVENQFPGRTNLAEALGMRRQDMYRYFAFDALPVVVIEKLEVNPRLLSRKFADDIKSVLSKTSAEQNEPALSALKEAMDLLEAGKLDQNKIVNFIKQKLKPKNEAESGTTDPLFSHDKQVGSFSVTPKTVTIQISTAALSDVQIEATRNWFNQLLNEPET